MQALNMKKKKQQKLCKEIAMDMLKIILPARIAKFVKV